MDELKSWIAENLQYSRGLVCKKCKHEWFEKYGHLEKWQQIHSTTSFLDNVFPTLPQRVWHIINDKPIIVTCNNPSCQNVPQFWSFNIGYLRTCSLSCAQHDPLTREHIKTTNIKNMEQSMVFRMTK
jgi:hypothetical protein